MGLLLAVTAPACGDAPAAIDARPRADAHITDYSCNGQPPPDQLPDTIIVRGLVFQPGIPGVTADLPLANAFIQALEVGTNRQLSFARSNEDGTYELVTYTENDPYPTYLKATLSPYLETRIIPPRPPTGDITFDVPLFLAEDKRLLQERAEVEQADDLAFVIAGVVDCTYYPVAGATVSVSPPASNIVYQDDLGFPHPNITSTSHEGFAFLFNIPPGEITVSASANGVDFLPVTGTVTPSSSDIVWGIGVAP